MIDPLVTRAKEVLGYQRCKNPKKQKFNKVEPKIDNE